MARNKTPRCGTRTRIVSNTVRSMQNNCGGAGVNSILESPDVLSLQAPLIYDEIGINLCTIVELGTDLATEFPTAVTAKAQVINITFDYGEDGVSIEDIPGKPSCYEVTLSNLLVQFVVGLYDSAGRLVTTLYPAVLYLPSSTDAETYDEDTNPTSVQLEIFAPYGVSYLQEAATDIPTPVLNVIGFLTTNNFVQQGINLYGMAKALNFNLTEGTVSLGLTLVLQSLYFAGYRVESAGKINTPKGSLVEADTSYCLSFVAGDLLNLAIKPLELSSEDDEEQGSLQNNGRCDTCQHDDEE